MKPTHWKRLSVVVAGIVLSVLFLWLALRQVDVAGLQTAFSSLRYLSIFFFCRFSSSWRDDAFS